MTNCLLQHSCSLLSTVPNISRFVFYLFFFQASPLSSTISSLVDDGHWPSSDIPVPGWPSPSYLNIFSWSILIVLSTLPVFSDWCGGAVKLVCCTALCSWNLSLLGGRYKDVLILPLSSQAAVPLKGKRPRIVANYSVRLLCPGTNVFCLSENFGTGPHDTRAFARWSSGTCAWVCNLEMLDKEVISLFWYRSFWIPSLRATVHCSPMFL